MLIDQNWKIQWFEPGEVRDLDVADPEYPDHFWIPAKVPGDVHSTLLEKKIIDDPYVGHNDQKCRWIERKVWWYRTEFHFHDPLPKEDRLELVFEGLDTYATVYLNGVELGSTENMFIAHTFDVTREIRPGRNVLAVKCDPIHLHVQGKKMDLWAPFAKERVWIRKAQMNFGWDWGPRLVTVGIWKEVRLEKRSLAKLESVFAKTLEVRDGIALVEVETEVRRFVKDVELDVEVSLSFGHETFVQTAPVRGHKASVVLEVTDPKLWWTHDVGMPHLYQLEVQLRSGGRTLQIHREEFGIRTLEVQRRDDEGKPVFTFVLNGVKLFAKGANWIPVDSMIGAAPDSRYAQLIRLAREAHMNMLRVWGGGIYEKDIFYQECNRQGILVWQDFMFACALYPDFNRNFMENVRQEIAAVVKRLRNYACLALWCGNNENDWLWEALSASGEIDTPFYGEKIYHELIPELLETLDPTRLYWPSSPYGGNDHNSAEEGDRHNWQVWHGNVEPRRFGEPLKQDYSVEGVSFKNYKKDLSTFVSEFGMHASANRYTLERRIPAGKFYWGSDELAYRNKDFHHQKGLLLMQGYTGIPTNVEEYLNFSMLTQAEGLKFGVEHYRRRKPSCSGALIWQLNDCWPGTSWSLIDYDLLPKASYYYAKKFFQPVLLSVDHEQGKDLTVWVVNDTLKAIDDVLHVDVCRFDGERVFQAEIPVAIGANRSVRVARFTEEEILRGTPANRVVVRLSLEGGDCENVYYLRDQKDLELPECRLHVTVDADKQEVTVSTDTLARFVKLELPAEKVIFSDNYFDLWPGRSKTVSIGHLEGKPVPLSELKVSAINGGRRI